MFRAYFNHGLINYIYGNERLLPAILRVGVCGDVGKHVEVLLATVVVHALLVANGHSHDLGNKRGIGLGGLANNDI